METQELVERARAVNRLPPPRERRRIREAAGATQLEFAGVLKVGVMTLNRWERGLTRPRGRNAAAYAALLEELDGA
jgi:DNA-binding transcriptional regulator YiaG